MRLFSWPFGSRKGRHASQSQDEVRQVVPLPLSDHPDNPVSRSVSAPTALVEFRTAAIAADAVVLDTETISSEIGTQVVEIGAILLRNGFPIHEYEQLITPVGDLPVSAKLFSKITEADTAEQPEAAQVIPVFIESMMSLTIIGHNISYDIAAINREADRMGCPHLANNVIDTQRLGSDMFPNAPSMSLLELSKLLGVADEEAHRALQDARQTLACWHRLRTMDRPRFLSTEEQRKSAQRAITERRRKDKIFAKSAYLKGLSTTPINVQPKGHIIESMDCGVEISGDEHHQDILRSYGYDAWLWVYVTEDRIRSGKYLGYPTYWVYLDGEEIGHISKYQMERHCGQVPADGAVMLAHIPDRAKDRDQNQWQLRLQMPDEHAPVDLSSQVVLPSKPEPEIKPIRSSQTQKESMRRSETRGGFVNAKPHKIVLSPTERVVSIVPTQGIDILLSDLDDNTRMWVTVRPTSQYLAVRFTGTLIGTVPLPDNLDPFGNEAKVTAATIRRISGETHVEIELPKD
ncbi:DNA polymerase III subunit epsilon [Bifidobacterium goeldii]|uniref:DNA polymerase III subunit epsilon n=1 Tax=Bifidobacterium goeldii TaxID=2306975 RepID=A0A430FMH4_9BIFI|nr:3'-5' exonuclease [Bifidobacterium goeldii]RSX54094.1 DNA polymerase III subunit epsilon [Bifidobacterium goeldii]